MGGAVREGTGRQGVGGRRLVCGGRLTAKPVSGGLQIGGPVPTLASLPSSSTLSSSRSTKESVAPLFIRGRLAVESLGPVLRPVPPLPCRIPPEPPKGPQPPALVKPQNQRVLQPERVVPAAGGSWFVWEAPSWRVLHAVREKVGWDGLDRL